MSDRMRTGKIDVTINVSDLLGPLGYKTPEDVQPSIMSDIISEVDRCKEMIEGKAIYTFIDFEHLPGNEAIRIDGLMISDKTLASLLDGAKAFAAAICTIGPAIDKFIDECFVTGDFLRGMIADVVGNRAVEDVARRCARLICVEANAVNLWPSVQASPGYGKWDTGGQRAIFAMLDASPIGVSLNEYCMMQPKKSISFIVPLSKDKSEFEDRSPCHGCGFKGCDYRRR